MRGMVMPWRPPRHPRSVQNIWHSSLRCKNPASTGSLLRIYADAVRNCSDDSGARQQAYQLAKARLAKGPEQLQHAPVVAPAGAWQRRCIAKRCQWMPACVHAYARTAGCVSYLKGGGWG